MKITFITIFSFAAILVGCSNYDRSSVEDIEIMSAEFKHWSEAPPVQSDVRERGTDLQLIIKNWPEEATPGYIIFRGKKSFPAEITDTTETGVKINARLIMQSAVLSETSQTVNKSDRLVFTRSDGKTRFIEIEEWNSMEN